MYNIVKDHLCISHTCCDIMIIFINVISDGKDATIMKMYGDDGDGHNQHGYHGYRVE